MGCFLAVAAAGLVVLAAGRYVPERYHMKWLSVMIWGSVLALTVEHIWHGEIVPYFPFLTAGASEVLTEIAVIGVPMLLAVVGIWAAAVYAVNKWEIPISSKAAA